MPTSRESTRAIALSKWHSCSKLGKAFRACPLMIAGAESSPRRETSSEKELDEPPDGDPPPRTQETLSQPGMDTALITLLRGLETPAPLSPNVPAPGGAGKRPDRVLGLPPGLPEGIRALVGPVIPRGVMVPGESGGLSGVLNVEIVEAMWRNLISEKVELTSTNAGPFLGPVLDSLTRGSEQTASMLALRIAESFIGKLLQQALRPSGTASPSFVSTTPTSTSPKEGQSKGVPAKTIGGLAVAGTAAVGAGILHKTRGGRGGGRGVSSPSPRGAGGKFFQAGQKFPILQPR